MLDDERGIEDILNLNAGDNSSDNEEAPDNITSDPVSPSDEATEYQEHEAADENPVLPEEGEPLPSDTPDGFCDDSYQADEVFDDDTSETKEDYAEEEDDEDVFEEDSFEEDSLDEDGYEEDEIYGDLEPEEGKKGMLPLLLGIFIPIALIAFAAAFLTLSDSAPAKKYRENFSNNVSSIAHDTGIDLIMEGNGGADGEKDETEQKKPRNTGEEYNEEIKTAVTVPFENALTYASFAQYKRGAACAGENYLVYIKYDGKEQWRVNTTVTNPIVKAEGAYIALAEKGGRKLCLYSGDKLLYDIYTDENILSVGMNDRGDVAAVTEKASYRGAVSVYNKSGDNIFTWSSGGGMITAADISSSSRRLAAAVVNTDNKVYSTVSLFDVKKEDSYSQIVCEDTLIFDISCSGKHLNVFGDNSMIGITEEGEVVYDKRFDNAGLAHSAVDQNGNKLMVFEYENAPTINVYSRNGALQYTMTAKTMPDSVDIKSYNVIYNEKRDIILGKPNSKKPHKYTAAMDVKDIVLIDAKSFLIVYSNSIEAVSFK